MNTNNTNYITPSEANIPEEEESLFWQLNKIILQIGRRYAIILPYKGKERPFIAYKLSNQGVFYLETMFKHSRGYFYLSTHSVRSDNMLESDGTKIITDEKSQEWIKYHKENIIVS